jgi:hypothetical protein
MDPEESTYLVRAVGLEPTRRCHRGIYRKDVAVRMIVRRWTRTAVTRLSEVRSRLKSSRRELASLPVARIELQYGRSGRNIHNQPVPNPLPVGASGS